ncbi:hypothetical protein SLE2022_209100 [Rubroshorea leprosula]
MHHGLNADDVLHLVSNIKGEVGGGATSAPGDVAECRIVRHHPVHPLEEVVDSTPPSMINCFAVCCDKSGIN